MEPTEPATPDKTAAIVIIGDEILSGKVTDVNAPYLLKELYRQGVRVRRVITIPDDVDVIAEEVRKASDQFDFVLTSGGVGPTHDDKTFNGVAQAFRLPLIEEPTLKQVLENHVGGQLTPAALRMARVPKGTRLVRGGEMRFPLCVVRNVYVFPGVPNILRSKFESVRHEFQGTPLHQLRIYTQERESQLAAALEATLAAFPDLTIGSYPTYDNRDYRVMITLEATSSDVVEQARDALLARLDTQAVVRVETYRPTPPPEPEEEPGANS